MIRNKATSIVDTKQYTMNFGISKDIKLRLETAAKTSRERVRILFFAWVCTHSAHATPTTHTPPSVRNSTWIDETERHRSRWSAGGLPNIAESQAHVLFAK